MLNSKKLEYGDYQTPLEFCNTVVNVLKKLVTPNIILEPTFGIGNFITASYNNFDGLDKIYGIEINPDYYDIVNQKYSNIFTGFNENIFDFRHNKIIEKITPKDNLLILGNPPWVTNSQLMSNDLKNLPQKNNFKNLKGFESLTGASNFDICEYIILDLLNNYKNIHGSIAMLCKTSVVTNIIKEINKYNFELSDIRMYTFDAKAIFNVSCEACLFFAKIGEKKENTVKVYDINFPDKSLYSFGWKSNKFYSNFNVDCCNIDGHFPIEWRQGIKHDCSKIMELKHINNNMYINGLKENIDIEPKYVYPLLKSSDLKNNFIEKSNKYVIVTQNKVKQDTSYISYESPKLWNYLIDNKEKFDARKSSIYKNAPDFSIFGIGDYSFSKYKVAISGFYKNPNFVVLSSNDKPIMLDDTCYFIGFEKEKDAIITMVLLNSDIVQNFLTSVAFLDKKRPYTKDILMRIDLPKILSEVNFDTFNDMLNNYNINTIIDKNDYNSYKNLFYTEKQISLLE